MPPKSSCFLPLSTENRNSRWPQFLSNRRDLVAWPVLGVFVQPTASLDNSNGNSMVIATQRIDGLFASVSLSTKEIIEIWSDPSGHKGIHCCWQASICISTNQAQPTHEYFVEIWINIPFYWQSHGKQLQVCANVRTFWRSDQDLKISTFCPTHQTTSESSRSRGFLPPWNWNGKIIHLTREVRTCAKNNKQHSHLEGELILLVFHSFLLTSSCYGSPQRLILGCRKSIQ